MNDRVPAPIGADEDVERAKRWWQENRVSIIGGIALGLAGVVGYNGWQWYQNDQANRASNQYAQLQAVATDNTQLKSVVSDLKADHKGQGYATLAAFTAAKQAVADADYSSAESELRWVIDNSGDSTMIQLAEVRLAAVLNAAGKHQQTIDLLAKKKTTDGSFVAVINERLGDAYAALGNVAEANTHYDAALANMPFISNTSELIAMKKNSLQVEGS